MNRTTLMALCAAAGTCAASAAAQSTVTVSGIVDAAARHVSNQGVGSVRSLVSGSNSTSRLVFSGREDMGGGLAAGFHLEHGLLLDSGTPASADKFWDRRSTVSLSGTAWGELRLGRDFVPSYVAWSRYDPFSYVGVARSANLVSATPTGPIRSAFGTNANTTVRSDNAGSFRDTVVGGHVDLAPVRLSAAAREFRQNQAKQRLLLLGAVATLGQHELKASWVKADLSGRVGTTSIDSTEADQWGLGYVYNLSKRTAMYATVARIGNDGAARYVISDGPAGMAAGGTSRGYEAGVRHRF
jgi:predicted porin